MNDTTQPASISVSVNANIRLSLPLRDAIHDYAKAHHISASDLIRHATALFIGYPISADEYHKANTYSRNHSPTTSPPPPATKRKRTNPALARALHKALRNEHTQTIIKEILNLDTI